MNIIVQLSAVYIFGYTNKTFCNNNSTVNCDAYFSLNWDECDWRKFYVTFIVLQNVSIVRGHFFAKSEFPAWCVSTWSLLQFPRGDLRCEFPSTSSTSNTMLRVCCGEFCGTSNDSFRRRVIVSQLAVATDCFCTENFASQHAAFR